VPTTVVHASELSQAAILEGIRKGHVFVDIWGSPAGLLEVEAEAGGQHGEMGDALGVSKGTHVRVSVYVAGVPSDAVVTWAGDRAKLLNGSDLIADGHRHWLRADVHSADGKLLLLGNPIYLVAK